MKKVLLTGGTGFIGKHIVPSLIKKGYEVHLVSQRKDLKVTKGVTVHGANLLDCSTHQTLINVIKPSYLLHAAWYTENGKFWDAVDNVYWLQASISLANNFYSYGGRRLLGLGTCAEYDWNTDICVEGVTPDKPESIYGKMKLATYEALSTLANHYQKEFIWSRIFFPYGPGEPGKRLIPYVISCLLRNEDAKCTHGEQVRDFMHVQDMGSALAAILDADITGIVNVGSGDGVKIRAIVHEIASILGREELVKLGSIAEPAYSPNRIVASVDRLTSEMQWSASLSLQEGLLQTVDWWRAQQSLNLQEES